MLHSPATLAIFLPLLVVMATSLFLLSFQFERTKNSWFILVLSQMYFEPHTLSQVLYVLAVSQAVHKESLWEQVNKVHVT